jgi:UDP-2-acetamido-3-amino-2,3-dideoxy-glucuronate N-acetyltransferase
MSKDYFAHETACIDEGAEIGAGTKIWHFTHIMPKSKVGKKCNFGQNVVVSPGCVIGDNVKFRTTSASTPASIRDDVFARRWCSPM